MSELWNVLCIDPGPTFQGVALVGMDDDGIKKIHYHACLHHDGLLELLRKGHLNNLQWHDIAVEKIVSYGRGVGEDVFATCRMVGRVEEIYGKPIIHIPLQTVRSVITGKTRQKDGDIAQHLYAILGPAGTKKAPGFMYGVTKHAKQAVAVGLCYYMMLRTNELEPMRVEYTYDENKTEYYQCLRTDNSSE